MDLFLSPHYDDETLFGSFSICKSENIDVVICFEPVDEAESYIRFHESQKALEALNHDGFLWKGFSPNTLKEKSSDYIHLLNDLQYADASKWYEVVFAPMEEVGGNPDHNLLARAADKVFGQRVTHYATYTWPAGKTRTDKLVPCEPNWIARKHKALSCHLSQIERSDTMSHFLSDLNEYYV